MAKSASRGNKRKETATASAPAPRMRHSDTAIVPHETSSQRARVPDVVPAAWLDRLLVAAVELPLASGERAVVTAIVEAVSSILPGYAVGACFVPAGAATPRDQVLVKRLPDGMRPSSAGVDPARLFPFLAHEYVAPLPGSTTGSTLHLASDGDPLDAPRSEAVHLLDRAAMVLARALGVARDLASPARTATDTSALEARLIQADKLATFGQIAAGVVHELNNPLTSIVAYSDYLIRKAISHDGARPREEDDVERLRRISESANRMLRFTRDLVSYARPSNGVAGPVVLHGVIDQAVAFCEHVLASAGVRVEKRYGSDVRAVRGVSEQLVQVFVNLLTNASQAAPPADGLVVLTTSAAPGSRRVRVVVEDNGSGIAREHITQLFVPFFTTKGDRHGTGLGLSIVKSILESHDGEIHVESEPGRGARFVLELPTWNR